MASNVVLPSSQQPKKGNLISLFASSDQEIRTQICATHVPNDEKFDVDSLFIVVENILKRATLQVADNLVPGTQATVEHLEEKTPKASFSPPLCTLKSISCEMQCKGTGEETAYETTMSILYKLSKYSWGAKAVLTLAAFALDYGELWVLAQSQSSDSDKVAKFVGTLRRVSVLLKRPRQALIELNTVIKATLEVIGCIFELEKLSKYGTKDVPALSTVIGDIPVDVFWVIVTVVVTTTQLCCLTNDDDKQQELSQFSGKLNVIATKLKSQITICRQQIEEIKEVLSNKIDLIHSLATHHENPDIISDWIDDQRYIFFYGGNDEWIEQFINRARVVINDVAINHAGIFIELACVGKGSNGEDNRGQFWTDIERMFISETRRKTDSTDSMTGEIWKLLSYKNESGWAILSKGSNVVLSAQGTNIMKVVEDFDNWKKLVLEKGLDVTINDQHKNVLGTTTHICRRIDISNTSGIIPDQNMKCPCCDRIMVMETYISFKYCCHHANIGLH